MMSRDKKTQLPSNSTYTSQKLKENRPDGKVIEVSVL